MNLHLKITNREEIAQLIECAFRDDIKLLSEYHISSGTLEHCVSNTLSLIHDNADHYKGDMEMYSLNIDERPIGFTIIVKNEHLPNELYSFGINIEYRTEEVKKEWLRLLSEVLGEKYYIVLWSKNTRAINFFEKNGFKVERRNKYLNDETKTLIICPQVDSR